MGVKKTITKAFVANDDFLFGVYLSLQLCTGRKKLFYRLLCGHISIGLFTMFSYLILTIMYLYNKMFHDIFNIYVLIYPSVEPILLCCFILQE